MGATFTASETKEVQVTPLQRAMIILATAPHAEDELPYPHAADKAINSEDLACMQMANATYLFDERARANNILRSKGR